MGWEILYVVQSVLELPDRRSGSRLVADEGYNHAVEVEEEHDEVEAEFDEGFLEIKKLAALKPHTASSTPCKRKKGKGYLLVLV